MTLADDFTSTAEVLQNQVLNSSTSEHFDAIILLQVTNPLRPENLSEKCLIRFEQSNSTSLCTYSPLNHKFGQIKANRFYPENYFFGQRMQDLTPRYYENGLFYVTKKAAVLDGFIITEDVEPFIVDHIFSNIDIDEEIDLQFAEYVLKHYQNRLNFK
jgi:N-acylneuraminate cytidylyltransferase